MKIKHFLPAILIIFLSSCSDEKAEDALRTENVSEEINTTAGEINDDVVTLVQSNGVKGALSLIDLYNNSIELGRISPYHPDENKTFVRNQANKLAHYFTFGIAALLDYEPEEFIEKKGVYEWNFDLEDFERTGESEFIVIAFPVDGAITNNGEFRLTKLKVIEIDGEELPTAIEADLSVDDDEFINLSFVVNYSSDGAFEVADIFLLVKPFALDLNFNDRQATVSELDATLLLDGEKLVGVDVSVEFDSEEKQEPSSISGEVFYKNLRLVGSISDTEMDNSDDGDPNDYIDLDLYLGENKAGDIIFIEEVMDANMGESEYVPYVVYADGTQENLEDILQPILDEIEATFEDLEVD